MLKELTASVCSEECVRRITLNHVPEGFRVQILRSYNVQSRIVRPV